MKKQKDFEDDGRTIADMSSLESRPALFGRRPAGRGRRPQEQQTPPTEETYTPEERRWAVLGALKATLLIGGVYLVGLGGLIVLLLWLWGVL